MEVRVASTSISQLDLLLLGRRGLTSRLTGVERTVRELTLSGSREPEAAAELVRPNLLVNSSFEFYDRAATRPNDWTVSGTAALAVGVDGADGSSAVLAQPGGALSQAVATGQVQLSGAAVISVAARASAEGIIALSAAHTPGITLGPIYRIDSRGNEVPTDVVPGDGEWYRFWRPLRIVGGATVTVTVGCVGSAPIYLDAAKYEKEDGEVGYIEPSAYIGGDWGASLHLRNLSADNITAGTLTVGGADSENPRISVRDDQDTEIVTIGDPSGGFYGIDLKGAAGLRVSGTGTVSVNGGGSINVGDAGGVNVTGTGGVNVTGSGSVNVSGGGSVKVSGTGKVIVGNPGGQRTEVRDYGVVGYAADGSVVFGLNELGAVGSLDIQNGDVLIGNGGASYAFWDNSAGTLKIVGTISGSTIEGSLFRTPDQKLQINNNGITLRASNSPNKYGSVDVAGAVHFYSDTIGDETGYVYMSEDWSGAGRNVLVLGSPGYGYDWHSPGRVMLLAGDGNGSTYRAYLDGVGGQFTAEKNIAADNCRIGAHPTYGSDYAALWRWNGTGNDDYALLANANYTFINSRSGSIYFCDNNVDRATLSADGLHLAANLYAGGGIALGGGATIGGGIIYLAGGRVGLWDAGDGYLRLGQGTNYANNYANGVHAPSNFWAAGQVRASAGIWAEATSSIRITPSASVGLRVQGVGVTSSTYSFAAYSGATGNLFYARDDGYLWANRAWDVSSDGRLKRNIKKLEKRQGRVNYREYVREDDGSPEFGVVAQEVQAVYPELVHEHTLPPGKGGSPGERVLAVNYQGLLVAEVARLTDELEAALVRIEALEQKLYKAKPNKG